jgi:hypothetical protein
MAVKKNSKTVLKKLKKQVRVLEKKEEQAKNQLRTALKKIRKLGRVYRSKLAVKARQMKGKIAEAQATTYVKAAVHLERQLLKGIDAKSKALESAITKLEKKHVAKLKKNLAKKGKKAGKTKKKTGNKMVPAKKTKRSIRKRSHRRSKRK